MLDKQSHLGVEHQKNCNLLLPIVGGMKSFSVTTTSAAGEELSVYDRKNKERGSGLARRMSLCE
jgi:hypothetical protein